MFDAAGMTLTGGILEGTGTVAANLTNGGEVRPGTSPGTLAVDGAYTQTAAGVLVAEITASGHDLLDATGVATLDGTLEVETAAGFTPSLGDTFKVVEGASRTGEFADVNGIGPGPYEVLYEADGSACRRSTRAICRHCRSATSPCARARPAPSTRSSRCSYRNRRASRSPSTSGPPTAPPAPR